MTEMKKSSYYVLFLGAKESKGLRGANYIEPVLQFFVSREQRIQAQALKVTLQVSNKGIRIIPTLGGLTLGPNSSPQQNSSSETHCEKHFIPQHAITCVFQAPPPNDDIVSCILLIYNPSTKCPVHVHTYRCDSPETAEILKNQLEALVNREDNQRKFRDIENRLQSKGLLVPSPNSTSNRRGGDLTPEFDCRNSESSESSDRGLGSGGSGASNLTSDRIANLYDSLAAELREKLNSKHKHTPILLPPKDYDTVNRQRGNLSGIDKKRCLNPAIVGMKGNPRKSTYPSREQESCGRSSGIGSTDDNCSPINPIHDPLLENHPVPSSSDDEEWHQSQVIAATESSQYLVRPLWPRKLPSPVPPPLPKRPELRQRSPDVSAPPPLPIFSRGCPSRERFEGVRQKWEKINHHQYNNRRSHDSLDEGYRSREAAEADYRRQLSRESLLRSLSRSKAGSKDSLDRWVENGRVWNDDPHGKPMNYKSIQSPPPPHENKKVTSNSNGGVCTGSGVGVGVGVGMGNVNVGGRSHSRDRGDRKERQQVVGTYRELKEDQRFPGLDKETARMTLHSSQINLTNLNHQHIYSEPSFSERPPPPPLPTKSKKFSFAFWK